MVISLNSQQTQPTSSVNSSLIKGQLCSVPTSTVCVVSWLVEHDEERQVSRVLNCLLRQTFCFYSDLWLQVKIIFFIGSVGRRKFWLCTFLQTTLHICINIFALSSNLVHTSYIWALNLEEWMLVVWQLSEVAAKKSTRRLASCFRLSKWGFLMRCQDIFQLCLWQQN